MFHDKVKTHDNNEGESLIIALYRMFWGGQETVDNKQAV